MPWLLGSPGHQQLRYWLCSMNKSLSFVRNYKSYFSLEKFVLIVSLKLILHTAKVSQSNIIRNSIRKVKTVSSKTHPFLNLMGEYGKLFIFQRKNEQKILRIFIYLGLKKKRALTICFCFFCSIHFACSSRRSRLRDLGKSTGQFALQPIK